MTHIGTQYIETDRLILRRFELSDAPAMFANWASDDEVTKYLTWPTHAGVSVTEWVVGEWVGRYPEKDFYQWAIVLKENGPEPIGSISVVKWTQDGAVPEIGYCMGRRWWHRGIMAETLNAVIGFLFDQVGVRQVFAEHDVSNPHSGDVMRKCGMTFEGVREKAGQNNQGIVDMACYTIKASDR